MLSFRWVLGDMTDNSPGEILALLADLANADEEHVDVGSGKGDFGVGILVDRWIYTSDLGRLFGGRPVAFPGGDIMKAVRGVVLSAFPGCDTRGCQGRWGAGPVVGGGPGGAGAVPAPPRPRSAPTARPAWWDGVSHVVTRPARLDHLRAVGPLAFR